VNADSNWPGYRLERLTACPNCDGLALEPWAASADLLLRLSQDVFEYARCDHCGCVFQQLRPSEDTAGHFYQGDYAPYAKVKRKRSPFRALHKIGLQMSARITGESAAIAKVMGARDKQLSGPDRVFLDFGCGSGALLDQYKKRFGCTTIGMDFNASLFPELNKRGHKTLDTSAASWSSLPDSSVDLAVLNHVLEHLYHPRDVVRQLLRVLKPGGLLDIAVPNPEGVSAERFRGDWFALDAPRHVILYGPRPATALLKACGFANVEVVGKAVTKDYLRSDARRKKTQGGLPPESNGLLALEISRMIKREAAQGRFDQFHLLARKPS
jgi:SAM-dependent methyltransferase